MTHAHDRRARLVETIRNMMNRANDPRTPEEERDAAARLITKWIAKHQIEAAELRGADKTADKAPIVMLQIRISNKFGLGPVRADALANSVILPMGGKALRTTPKSAQEESVLTAFVSEDIKEAVQVLLTGLLLQMESGLKRQSDDHRRKVNAYGLDAADTAQRMKAFRYSYLHIFGLTVGDRVKAGRQEALDEVRQEAQAEAYSRGVDGRELAEVGKELELVDDSARAQSSMEAWFRRMNGADAKLGMARRRTIYSPDGQRAGYRDGQRADIGQTRVGGQRAALSR